MLEKQTNKQTNKNFTLMPTNLRIVKDLIMHPAAPSFTLPLKPIF